MNPEKITISTASPPGHDAAFKLYVPDTITTATPPPNLADSDGLRILFLDDEEELVLMATNVLERWGYRVTGFTTAAEALAALRAAPNSFDLMVTDHNMPGMSGIDVSHEITMLRLGLPVILTSGNLTDELFAEAREAGIQQLLPKPYTMEEVCQAILRQMNPAERKP